MEWETPLGLEIHAQVEPQNKLLSERCSWENKMRARKQKGKTAELSVEKDIFW